MEKIRQVVTEIWVPQVWQPPARTVMTIPLQPKGLRGKNEPIPALTTWVFVDITSLHGRACAPHDDTRRQVDSTVNETWQDGQRSWKYHRNQLANQQKLKWRYPKICLLEIYLVLFLELEWFEILPPYINRLVQERCNSIANALELHLSRTNTSIYELS